MKTKLDASEAAYALYLAVKEAAEHSDNFGFLYPNMRNPLTQAIKSYEQAKHAPKASEPTLSEVEAYLRSKDGCDWSTEALMVIGEARAALAQSEGEK